MNDFDFGALNRQIIEEFRANEGKVNREFEGAPLPPLLLLTTTGARSGKQRINPLAYTTDGERLVIIASKAGMPTNPDWYHNIVAHPDVTVEVGSETFEARATIVEGAERDELYARHAAILPDFAEYQAKTTRKIPVIVLTRKQ